MNMGADPVPIVAQGGERLRVQFPFNTPAAALLIVVPLRRSWTSFPGFSDAILESVSDLERLSATILFVGDGSEDRDSMNALEALQERMAGRVAVELLANTAGTGYVAGVNRALEIACSMKCDVVVLDPDVLVRPGVLAEMLAVAYIDPLVAFVGARSENTAIGSYPGANEEADKGGDAAFRAYCIVEPYLPRYTYAPMTDCVCLLIRRSMLVEFGLLDIIYETISGACKDLFHRCNQRGYRAVLANRTYVDRVDKILLEPIGDVSAEQHRPDRALLADRYPERGREVARHLASAEHRAEQMLIGLVPIDGRHRILFDCRILEASFNGTFEHICRLLAAFAANFADRYDIRVLCGEAPFRFHGLDDVGGLRYCSEEEALRSPSAIAFRLNQPDASALASLCRFGSITGALMLDTIAMDCHQLDGRDLRRIWSHAASHLDLIGSNSQFTRDQFARRFRVPDRTVQFVSLCSASPGEYAPTLERGPRRGGILLIGNHYPHKHLRETVRTLRAIDATLPITCFGILLDEPGVVASYDAGSIAEEVVDRLYADAGVALFPSHYEGFGLPIMHALARGIPVVARDLPCAREIKACCPAGRNLHLCASTQEMAALAASMPAWHDDPPDPGRTIWNWPAAAGALADAFEESLRRFDFGVCQEHVAAALIWEEACLVPEQRSRIAHLENGLDLARHGLRRLDEEVRGLDARFSAAGDREARADLARRDAEEAEAYARARHVEASERADEAETRERLALDAQRIAEAAVEEAHATTVGANERADAADMRAAISSDLLTRLMVLRSEPVTSTASSGRLSSFRLWLTSRHWPRRTIGNIPPHDLSLGGLRLMLEPAACELGASRVAFLAWSQCVVVGGDLWVERARALDQPGSGDDDTIPLRALLALAGFTETSRGRSVVRAIKTRDWPAFMIEEPRFVDMACHYWLGRDPTSAERARFEQRLCHGTPRARLSLEIAASDECWKRWQGAVAAHA